MTQEELADRCALFRTYLSRIEAGLANPSLTVLYALAEALSVPVQQLFESAQIHHTKPVRAKQPVSRGRVSG